MNATFKRIVIAAIVLTALAAGAVALVVFGGSTASAPDPLANMKNGAVNVLLDTSGIKGTIDSEIRSRAGELAAQYGVSEAMVDNIVDSLAIEDWQATTLPEDAVEEDTYTIDIDGNTAEITTYDDPGFVTVDAFGQSITLEVPESAQTYLGFAEYLKYLQ